MSFFTVLFGSLFATYIAVAGLIAFFTVKIVGIPIGPKMFAKIVLTIILFLPLYLLLAYTLSLLVTRDLKRLEKAIEKLPEVDELPESRIREFSRLSKVIGDQAKRISSMLSDQRLMIYRIAHDLRTPTANVRNILTAIRDGVIAEEEREGYIEKAVRETHRISDFLDSALSGLRKAVREREVSPVELGRVVRSVVEEWRQRALERGFEIECDVQDLKIMVPEEEIEEILSNLLENALMHSGGNRIEVSVKKEGERAVMVVSDNGRGATRELLVDSYRKGSIGLYIVKELVWKRGGEVRIESEGSGTKVAVSFPLI